MANVCNCCVTLCIPILVTCFFWIKKREMSTARSMKELPQVVLPRTGKIPTFFGRTCLVTGCDSGKTWRNLFISHWRLMIFQILSSFDPSFPKRLFFFLTIGYIASQIEFIIVFPVLDSHHWGSTMDSMDYWTIGDIPCIIGDWYTMDFSIDVLHISPGLQVPTEQRFEDLPQQRGVAVLPLDLARATGWSVLVSKGDITKNGTWLRVNGHGLPPKCWRFMKILNFRFYCF